MKQSKWVLMTQNVFYHDFASSPPIKIDALAPWHMINHALKFKIYNWEYTYTISLNYFVYIP